MGRGTGAQRQSTVGRLAVAVTAGLAAHLLLFNAGKDDSDPPVCHALLDYEVPCGNLSYAAASVTTGSLAVLLLRGSARRAPDRADSGDLRGPAR